MSKLGRRAAVTLLVVVTSVAVLIAFAQDQDTLKVRSAVAASDPGAAAYISALVGAQLSDHNSYEVLKNGDEIFPAMLGAINGARRRISFETYIFEGSQIGSQFVAAFEAAAQRGVRVNLVIDSVGASTMPAEDLERLKRAGCKVAAFNGAEWYQLEELNYRTHRKILVVDGETAFTGGAGIADHWLGNAQDREHWRDTQIRMRGPVARLVEAAFYENFIEEGGLVTPEIDPTPEAAPGIAEGLSFVVRSSPTGGSTDLKRLYVLLIASSRRSLDIATPYFITDESTIWALEDAVGRGVKVRVLTEGETTDAKSVKYASRSAYERLLSSGIDIYEYQTTMLHAKTLVVDGVVSMFGSANFDNRSLELNDELNVAVANRQLAGRLLEDFQQDLASSKQLTLEGWRQRSQLEKTREYFWSYFGELF